MKILGGKGVKKSKIASIYSSEYGKITYYTVLLYVLKILFSRELLISIQEIHLAQYL